MEGIIPASHSSFDLDVALRLYNRLNDLSAPWFAASRMKLPCIASSFSPYRTCSGRVYRADTLTLGWWNQNEIRPLSDEFSVPRSPLVGHSWNTKIYKVAYLWKMTSCHHPHRTRTTKRSMTRKSMTMPHRSPNLNHRHSLLPRVWCALLVTLVLTGRRAVDYRRVAADSMITVQFQEDVSLADLLNNVRTIDVL